MSSIYGIPLETCAHADGRKGCTNATLAYSPTVGGISCTKCGAYAGHGEALVCRWETISFAISQIGGLVERFEEDNRILAKKLEAAELLAATATQRAEAMEADADATAVGAAIQRAAGELPEDWSISVEIERGSGTVLLYNEGHDAEKVMDVDSDNRLAAEINAAIDAALSAAAESGE